jgi:predicted ABC-type ATPase
LIQPVLTIVAGANGAGKSTLTSVARAIFQQTPVLDPDAFAQLLEADRSAPSQIEAGKRVLRLCAEFLERRESFAVETTLSGKTYRHVAKQARELGYFVVLIYVGTESLEINLQRVRSRVEKGGHHVPEADQRRRYPRSLFNMKRMLDEVDFSILFDNSTANGHTLIGGGSRGAMWWIHPLPEWARDVGFPEAMENS